MESSDEVVTYLCTFSAEASPDFDSASVSTEMAVGAVDLSFSIVVNVGRG